MVFHAKKRILQYLSLEQYHPDACLKASEFYRRLSDPRSALKVIGEESLSLPPMRLQFSRILNGLGGSQSALRILRSISSDQIAKNPAPVVEIFLSNYQYRDAWNWVKDQRLESGASYSERLRLITKVDVLSGLNRKDEALDLLEQILSASREPLIVGILLQVKGAILLEQEKIKQSGEILLQAHSYFSDSDQTLDRGYLDKWLAAYFIQNRDFENAKNSLARAWKILYRPGIKPETWLEVLYWRGLLAFTQEKRFPEEWARILAYPQLKESRVLGWIREKIEAPKSFHLSTQSIGEASLKNHLDLESEVRHRPKFMQLGFNLTEKMIAQLVIGGDYGVPLLRMCETLWPDELYSYQANIKRIEQIIARARSDEKFKIHWSGLHLTAGQNPSFSVHWVRTPLVKGASFLNRTPEFTRREVEAHFGLSARRALNVCEDWRKNGMISLAGNSKNARYFRLS